MINKMVARLHVIGNPYLPTKKEYSTDYFTQICIKFCDMMYNRGHEIYFYGVEKEHVDIKATKYITILSLSDYEELNKMTDNYTDPYLMQFGIDKQLDECKAKLNNTFVDNLIPKLHEEYKQGDLVIHTIVSHICFYQYKTHVILSHGGGCIALQNVVFMTESWRDHVLSDKKNKEKLNTYAVVYPWFTEDEVGYDPGIKRDQNTYLYLARCQEIKGFVNFLKMAKHYPDYKFIVAGGCKSYDPSTKIMETGDCDPINLGEYPNVEYLGKIGIGEKKKLLQTVTALIQPTVYLEPGGSNVMEASLCGTPVIAPNLGGFVNTVINGKTGVLYNIDIKWSDYYETIPQVKKICSKDCYDFAKSYLNEDVAYRKYMEYFNRLLRSLPSSNSNHTTTT